MLGSIKTAAAWIPARINMRSQRGASAIEYAVVAAAIAAAVVLAVALLGRATDANIDCTEQSWRTLSEAC